MAGTFYLTNLDNFLTCMFLYSLKGSYRLQDIFSKHAFYELKMFSPLFVSYFQLIKLRWPKTKSLYDKVNLFSKVI